MKRYKCNKIVEAGEIASLGFGHVIMIGGECVHLDKDAEDRITKAMTDDWAKGLGYLVRYEDGYLSWSPKDAFEGGYTLIE